MFHPLKGIHVLDMSNVIIGPLSSFNLAQLGCDHLDQTNLKPSPPFIQMTIFSAAAVTDRLLSNPIRHLVDGVYVARHGARGA